MDVKSTEKTPGYSAASLLDESTNKIVPLETHLEKFQFTTALHIIGAKVMQALFKTFYQHSENVCSNRGKASFIEWQNKLGKSNRKIKELFGSRFQPPPNMDKDFDITTSLLFIMEMDPAFYLKNFCINCQNRMKILKAYKNGAAHNGPFPGTECNLHDLFALFQDLLKCSASDLGHKTFIEPVLKNLPNLEKQQTETKIEFIKNYRAALKFFKVPVDSFSPMSRCELRQRGISRIFAIPFYWIVNDFSDESKVTHEANKLYENVAMDVFTNPFIKCNSIEFKSEELLILKVGSETPQVIFIAGHGGCGKTTLCHHIFSKWLQGKSEEQDTFYAGLERVHLVVFIEMHSIQSKSLLKYLQNTYIPDTASLVREKELFKFLRSLNVLYIIDGFDEKNEVNVNLVHDIAKQVLCNPSNRVILATRPECLSDAKHIFSKTLANSTLLVDMIGFDRNGREEFSSKILSQKNVKSIYPTSVPKDFHSFLEEQEKTLSTYLDFPLTIALILLLWLQNRSRNKTINFCTATHLYVELFKMLTSKLILARKYSSKQGCSINIRSVKAVMDVLSQSAESAIFIKNFQIEIPACSIEKISECCEEYDVNLIEFMSAYTQFLSNPNINSKAQQFSFFHRNEMEYLSAGSLAKTLIASQPLVEVAFEDMHKWYGVLPFLVGVLSAQNKLDEYDSTIINHLKTMQVSSENLNFFSKLITESTTFRSHGNCCKKRFCSKLCELMPDTTWKLDASTVISGLHLLHHCTCIKLFELIIDLPQGHDPDKMSGFSERLFELSEVLCKPKPFRVCVSFEILNHYKNADRCSDNYLPLLVDWAKLVKFSGALGDEGVEYLTKFSCPSFLKLRISSTKTFNKFVDKFFSKAQKLKRLELTLDFPMDTNFSLLPLKPKCKLEVSLRFDHVARHHLLQTLHIIQSIWTKSLGRFDKVTFDSYDLDMDQDADTIKQALKGRVFSKVTVCSGKRSVGLSNSVQDEDCGFIFQWG